MPQLIGDKLHVFLELAEIEVLCLVDFEDILRRRQALELVITGYHMKASLPSYKEDDSSTRRGEEYQDRKSCNIN